MLKSPNEKLTSFNIVNSNLLNASPPINAVISTAIFGFDTLKTPFRFLCQDSALLVALGIRLSTRTKQSNSLWEKRPF
jgi:hypothetical protein